MQLCNSDYFIAGTEENISLGWIDCERELVFMESGVSCKFFLFLFSFP